VTQRRVRDTKKSKGNIYSILIELPFNLTGGFWKSKENRKEYFDWLGKELNYKSMSDWYQLQLSDIIKHGYEYSIDIMISIISIIKKCLKPIPL
jgi:hypothetical protein